MTETFKPIPGWEGFYEASNCGRIRSLDRRIPLRKGVTRISYGRILRSAKNRKGYEAVALSRDGMGHTMTVHKLVATTFLGMRPNPEMEIDHIDRCKTNNHVDNLRWVNSTTNKLNGIEYVSNTSGKRGVYLDRDYGTYYVQIKVAGKVTTTGGFKRFEDAVAARKVAELQYWQSLNLAQPEAVRC